MYNLVSCIFVWKFLLTCIFNRTGNGSVVMQYGLQVLFCAVSAKTVLRYLYHCLINSVTLYFAQRRLVYKDMHIQIYASLYSAFMSV